MLIRDTAAPVAAEAARVALLDDGDLPPEAWDLLSPAELSLLAGRPAERGRRFLRGRLAAKWLVLEALRRRSPGGAAGGTWLTRLGPELLARYPAADYRSLEVLPPPGRRTGRPRLQVAADRAAGGQDLPSPGLSLSHAGGPSESAASAAALVLGAPVGVDLEIAEPRTEAFYRRSFSAAERRWVETALAQLGPSPGDASAHLLRRRRERAFTALWAAKEAVLKTGLTAVGSAIDLPCLELRPRGACPGNPLVALFRPPGTAGPLAGLSLAASERGAAEDLHLSWCSPDAEGGGTTVLALAFAPRAGTRSENYPAGPGRRGEEAA